MIQYKNIFILPKQKSELFWIFLWLLFAIEFTTLYDKFKPKILILNLSETISGSLKIL